MVSTTLLTLLGKFPYSLIAIYLPSKGVISLITAPKDSQFDSRQFYMNCQQMKGFVISHASLKQLKKAGRIFK